ncbi:hypothetical protein RJ035_004585 [Blastomyces gilchristii]
MDESQPKEMTSRVRDSAERTIDATSTSPSTMVGHSPLIDQCLQFLSSANNATLATLGGVVFATIYFVFGKLSLVLFGAVAGAGLHALWEDHKDCGDGSVNSRPSKRKRELAIEVANRLLSWEESRTGDKPSTGASDIDISIPTLDYSGFQPATAAALHALTDAVIRDYVQPADIFLHFVTNASSIIIVFLNELSSALESTSHTPISTADAISSYLNEYPESNLANVLSTSQQHAKLRLVASDVLQTFLQPGVILESIIDNCSKPEWINGWIVHILEEGEPELMNAIDIGVDRARQDQMEAFSANSLADSSNIAEHPINERIVPDNSRTSLQNERLTKAQIEMEEAVREAKRLSAMIELGSTPRSEEQPSAIGTDSDIDIGLGSCSSKTPHPDATASPNDGNWNSHVPARPSPSSSPNELGDLRNPTGELRSRQEDSIQTILLGASVSIFDDSFPSNNGTMRMKPTDDYLLQIEPASSRHPGWVITRKYSDFEVLHEVLRRISVVSGVSDFVEQHKELPTWKGQHQPDLRQSLERYLQHALRFERLAGCEAMKRFLEKDRGIATSSPNGAGKTGFSFPSQAVFENMGKGVLEALSNAPKGVAGGGKAVLEGVTGVFGTGSGVKKRSVDLGFRDKVDSKLRMSSDEFVNKITISQDARKAPGVHFPLPSDTEHSTPLDSDSNENGFEKPVTCMTHNQEAEPTFKRPVVDQLSPSLATEQADENQQNGPIVGENHLQETKTVSSPLAGQASDVEGNTAGHSEVDMESSKSQIKPSSNEVRVLPLSEEETGVAVELLFAVINELYSLSSAWGIRKKLLNAARSFLLRPGNPNIEGIRRLVQESIIESNAADDALAAHITAIRENALPTEDELKSWPPPLTDDKQEELRIKARKLLVTRGMPQALTSIMGNAATTEALGRVFDSLQVKSVARGFIFALLLQALKAMIQ